MKTSQHVCAFALSITPTIARTAIVHALRENLVNLKDLHWRMHPAQVLAVSNLYETVALLNVSELKSLENIDAVRHLAKDYCSVTFLGVPIKQTAEIPESHIELCDEKEFVLVRITDLAIPVEMMRG